MSAIAPRRKGWCPGALRPMETGDGLLARVRASGGRLALDQAAAVAEGALACGNGAISLSARGNLQVRGVSEETLPDLQARLAAAGVLAIAPCALRMARAKGMATPTMNMKAGWMRSQKAIHSQGLWSNCSAIQE